MADGRHIEKCLKRYNSSTSGAIWTKLGWSHPIISPTWPPWCGCHGNGRCLANTHWRFSSYRRLEAERVIQFWWNLVWSSKFGTQWQSRDQIWNFQNSKWRAAAILENVGHAITRSPMDWFGWNVGNSIPSYSWCGRHDAVAMVTAVA